MTLFTLTCLLAVFPVISMKSPIFGPKELSSVEGKSVSIKCFYPDSSVNRHTRKYWCRQGASGRCTTLISSEGYISSDYAGRANLTNFPESNTFVVDIARLTKSDTGHYKCGLGISSRGLSFDVSLEVGQGPELPPGTQVYTADLGKNVTITCPFKAENAQKKKSLCKKSGQSCSLVIDSFENKGPSYNERTKFSLKGTGQLVFTVFINRLRPSDAGMFVCQVGDQEPSAEQSFAHLQVLKPEPQLVYGDLQGSVNFECNLGPEVANVPKFLCRSRKGGACEVIINTLGTSAPDFEGRIMLILTNMPGFFRVPITGLKKEDAGHYVCGAHPEGVPAEGWPIQESQLFINEETTISSVPSVVKGVAGGSVAVLCRYNPKESIGLKSWCRWEKNQNAQCSVLRPNNNKYMGRLALYEEPGNGTYTVILSQLTAQDAGFYWCLTDGDVRWRSSVELKVVEGKPNLRVPEDVTVPLGGTLKLPCHFRASSYSYEKYWCKWSEQGCRTLPSQDEAQARPLSTADQNSRVISLTVSPVTKADEGWYWCGVKQGHSYGDTMAVHVTVDDGTKGSHDVGRANAAPSEGVVEPNGRIIEPRANIDPSLVVEGRKDPGAPAGGSRAVAEAGSSAGQGGSSTVLVSTLVPLALVLALGAMALWVVRARHRRNVDRISIRSYRTDISMSDFENSRDFGANDNVAVYSVNQETSLEEKNECVTTPESITENEEPKKAKRSSKEEADMAYTAFLLQSNNMAANAQDGPKEA
ncbi:polymeric immunoglobulin receptor [Dasypus novemcinctus]|uniref:polymeric immunoglobulin receptor n=1 Tax=Dasypus novemcinctus TaxID=9361 RepID=UPI00265FBCE1|nr:polymeric immunoglobulin receptor [Dasypus novemcinctus]XP_004470112.2 polymeric immunoglobulin receptor [Dasypus novemcinctus]